MWSRWFVVFAMAESRKVIATSHQWCDGCYTNKHDKQMKAAGTSAWVHEVTELTAWMLPVAPSQWQPCPLLRREGIQATPASARALLSMQGPVHLTKLGTPLALSGEKTAEFCHAPVTLYAILPVWVGCDGGFFGWVSLFLPFRYLAIQISLLRESLPSKVLEEIIPILIYPFNMAISGSNINWKFGRFAGSMIFYFA